MLQGVFDCGCWCHPADVRAACSCFHQLLLHTHAHIYEGRCRPLVRGSVVHVSWQHDAACTKAGGVARGYLSSCVYTREGLQCIYDLNGLAL